MDKFLHKILELKKFLKLLPLIGLRKSNSGEKFST